MIALSVGHFEKRHNACIFHPCWLTDVPRCVLGQKNSSTFKLDVSNFAACLRNEAKNHDGVVEKVWIYKTAGGMLAIVLYRILFLFFKGFQLNA